MTERLPGIVDDETDETNGTDAAPFERPDGRVVRVQPDITSIARSFDYVVPPSWEADGRAERVAIGSLVRIDFHGRRTAGWVTEDDVEPSGRVEVLPLAKWSSIGPPAEVIELAHWAVWRWAGRLPHFLRAASPPRMIERLPPEFTAEPIDSPVSAAAFDGPCTLVQTIPSDDGIALALAAAARGRALVLVPTVMQRRSVVAALRAAGVTVAEYPDDWKRSAAGAVTVGTRLAAWAPLPAPDAMLVLDEHDRAYKEERTPSWNARDVVLERARRAGVPCVLASPSPSLESLERCERRLVADRAAVRNGWPIVDVVDMRTVDTPGLLTEHIVPALRGDGPVACVLNRKGRARMLSCASCDSLATCDACTAAVIQPDDEHLRCGRCGTTRPVVCRECGATTMKLLRPGIGRLAEDLAALAKKPVVEVTAETPPRDFTGDQLLIGTVALLHRLPAARAVIFLDFDQELAVPRSRASEDAFALLALAARRVGARAGDGRVLVQTRRPDDPVVQAAVFGDPDRVARSQRDVRKVFGQPPYGAWAVASGAGAEEFVECLDGSPVRVDRVVDRWRLSAPDHDVLLDTLASMPRPLERLRLEVDPLDL